MWPTSQKKNVEKLPKTLPNVSPLCYAQTTNERKDSGNYHHYPAPLHLHDRGMV